MQVLNENSTDEYYLFDNLQDNRVYPWVGAVGKGQIVLPKQISTRSYNIIEGEHKKRSTVHFGSREDGQTGRQTRKAQKSQDGGRG